MCRPTYSLWDIYQNEAELPSSGNKGASQYITDQDIAGYDLRRDVFCFSVLFFNDISFLHQLIN